jgi:hypothetical protein
MRSLFAAITILVVACGGTSPSPSPSTSVPELPPGTTEVPPGRYVLPDIVPGVAVELETGWSSGEVDGTVTLHRPAGADDAVVTFAIVDAGSATAAAEAAGATDGLTILASSESRMSGLSGPNLEIEHAAAGSLEVLPTMTGSIGLDPGSRMWLSLFDTSDGVVAIAVSAPVPAWDDALLAAEPLLESVTIQGGSTP